MSDQTQDVGEAGAAMNERVAVEVMGWRVFRNSAGVWACASRFCTHEKCGDGRVQMHGDRYLGPLRSYAFFPPAWKPSEDIAAAWEVVERMEARGWKVTYRSTGLRGRRVEVHVPEPTGSGALLYTAEAESAPLAICRAALAALDAA